MQKKKRLTEKGQDHQGIVESPKAQPEKIGIGPPNGPRPEGSEHYNGHTPIKWPGLEAVAQYLATPKPLREFKSINDLAKRFRVTRMTIHRWKHHPDVIKRVHWLASYYRLAGDLLARIIWPRIVEKVVEKAVKGDMQAVRFCEEIAWRQEKQMERAQISPYSLEEVLERAEREYREHYATMTPTWIKERNARLGYGHPPVAADVSEPETKPEPVPVAVNACDACGTTRCAHGRCAMCDICEQCK